ncbi:MAG: PEP-CTERM sorting domain-containing protein [Phycisphaerales bacterium]
MIKHFGGIVAMTGLCLASGSAFGALYSEDFNVDNSANWTVNDSGLSDILVDFSYDYSAIGVPSANGSDTLGLKMTANNAGGVFSGFSVSPTGESFTGDYKVSFDMWQNYVGPLGAGGSGTTQISMMGIGTAGNVAMWPGAATKESITFGVTLDGGSASDFRAYSSAAPTSYPSGNAVYASPGSTINNSDAYYTAAYPATAAPAAQTLLYPGQTGSTDAGEVSFAWRKVEIEVLGGIATWKIDGLLIATVDASTVTLGGGNILFGHSDTNNGSSADPNDTLLNVTLIDNVVVTPEPASLALLGLGGLAMLRRR